MKCNILTSVKSNMSSTCLVFNAISILRSFLFRKLGFFVWRYYINILTIEISGFTWNPFPVKKSFWQPWAVPNLHFLHSEIRLLCALDLTPVNNHNWYRGNMRLKSVTQKHYYTFYWDNRKWSIIGTFQLRNYEFLQLKN